MNACSTSALSTRPTHTSGLVQPCRVPAGRVFRSSCSRGSRLHVVRVSAAGFGKTSNKKAAPKKPSQLERELAAIATDTPGARKGAASSSSKQKAGGPPGFPEDWVDLRTTVNDFTVGKQTKPLILANGKSIMLYKHDNKVWCSDAASTAYQYPLTDAKVWSDKGQTLVEVPLDGTIYNLSTGAVVTWCPKDNPVRSLLGTLKSSVQPTPLPVYPVHITQEGGLWIKLLQ